MVRSSLSVLALSSALVLSPPPATHRANFLRLDVTASRPTKVRAIWRPRAGVVGLTPADQQRAIANPFGRPPADSIRRRRDPSARDTVVVSTPTHFVVDMTGENLVIEVVAGDSIRVEAQLTPARGPRRSVWGHVIAATADGVSPTLERRR
jgi:hypothetical protein